MRLGTYAVEGVCWQLACGEDVGDVIVSVEDGYTVPTREHRIAVVRLDSEYFEIESDMDMRRKMKMWMGRFSAEHSTRIDWLRFVPGTGTVRVDLLVSRM